MSYEIYELVDNISTQILVELKGIQKIIHSKGDYAIIHFASGSLSRHPMILRYDNSRNTLKAYTLEDYDKKYWFSLKICQSDFIIKNIYPINTVEIFKYDELKDKLVIQNTITGVKSFDMYKGIFMIHHINSKKEIYIQS